MPSSLVRAALALLCAGAVVFGTALFPAALDVELQQTGPETVDTPAGPATAVPTESGSDGESADPTPTPTPEPTPEPTPVPPDNDGTGDSGAFFALSQLVSILVGTAIVIGLLFGFVAAAREAGFDIGGSWNLGIFEHVSLPNIPLPFASVLQRIPQVTTTVLLAGAAMLGRVATGLGSLTAGILDGIAAGLGPLGKMTARSLGGLSTALAALTLAPLRALGALGAGGLFGSLANAFSRPTRPEDATTADARDAADVPTAEPEPPTLTEAWEEMIDLVPVANPSATTPGEYARKAIDIGLPAEPVRRLTALFRSVTYGGAEATGSRTEAARDALDRLRRGGDDQ